MMYEGQSIRNEKTAALQDASSPNSLSNITSRLSNCLEREERLIGSIEDRLHGIANKRRPQETERSPEGKPMNSDFVSSIHAQITRCEANNDKLDLILNHLSELE